MLTKKQNELLLYISQQISKDGVSPSFDEMKDRARAQVEVGRPQAGNGAGGAGVHPPVRQPRPRAGDREAAGGGRL